MSLSDRVEGKTELEIIVMDLSDVSHTLKKNKVGEKNTQDRYALEVLDDCIKRLRGMT